MTTTQRGGTSNVSQPLNSLQIVFKGQMCRLLILHLVCFSWAPMSMSLKVFSFERTQEVTQEVSTHEVSFERTQEVSNPPNSLSFATLDSETIEDLPSRFYWIIFYCILWQSNEIWSPICVGLYCAGLTSREPGISVEFSIFMESTTSPGSQSGSVTVG